MESDVSFSASAHGNAAKEILHFVKARNGVQTDLYSDIETVSLSVGSTLVITTTESLNFCSNQRVYKSLITLDLQNVEFDEAFDVFSEDLTIDDETEERQCENIRSYLGFERDNIDDYEVCRAFEDIKCDYSEGKGDESIELLQTRAKGGKIPDFEGFEFKEQTFAGFQYGGNEFEGFEFESFDPSGQLTFEEIKKAELESPDSLATPYGAISAIKGTIAGLEAAIDLLASTRLDIHYGATCPIPTVIIAGAGTDAACKAVDGIMAVILGALFKIEIGLGPVSLNLLFNKSFHSLFIFH